MKDLNSRFSSTLVIGGNGKTGRRVAERLIQVGVPVRIGSRSGEPPFDWQDPSTWEAVLEGMDKVYVTFYPDLAVPGATDAIQAFTDLAKKTGIKKLVLLSGRGEEEAQKCEKIVMESGLDWTILRTSWFNQNFSEAFLRDFVLSGVVALPAGEVTEPFIDADDIADVAVAALTETGHTGQLYELTGPSLLTFDEVVGEIARVSGREIKYVSITTEEFVAGMKEQGIPEEYVSLVSYLFTEVLDGRNSYVTDGVQRALGRPPREFKQYAKDAAATGVWN